MSKQGPNQQNRQRHPQKKDLYKKPKKPLKDESEILPALLFRTIFFPDVKAYQISAVRQTKITVTNYIRPRSLIGRGFWD
jgi:hypothetical protein